MEYSSWIVIFGGRGGERGKRRNEQVQRKWGECSRRGREKAKNNFAKDKIVKSF